MSEDIRQSFDKAVAQNGYALRRLAESDKRKIKLTRKEIEKVQVGAGWTPYWFETSHGIVNIPGPRDDGDYFDYSDDWLSCGCCSCCGCDCDYYPELAGWDEEDYKEDDEDGTK